MGAHMSQVDPPLNLSPAPVLVSREDWQDFLDPEGLRRKAGHSDLVLVAIKELADNAADVGHATVERVNGTTVRVSDDGPGLDPDDVPNLFDLRRPLTTSKIWRRANRGALGNGLRVVAGVVAISGGAISVTSRGVRSTIRIDPYGVSEVEREAAAPDAAGTMIELDFGSPVSDWAIVFAKPIGGRAYAGQATHPDWVDHDAMMTICRSAPARTIAWLAEHFAVQTTLFAGDGRLLGSLDRPDAAALVQALRTAAVKVPALIPIGPDSLLEDFEYAKASGPVTIGGAVLPAIVEVWSRAERAEAKDAEVEVAPVIINRTRALASTEGYWASRRVRLSFGGPWMDAARVAAASWEMTVAISCPYVSIRSDGKAPDLGPFRDLISAAASKSLAASRGRLSRARAGGRTLKYAAFDVMEEAYRQASGGGKYPANARQIMYAARPAILAATGLDRLNDKHFTQTLLPDYLAANPETTSGWDVVYDARGSFVEPHTGREVRLGTLGVRQYLTARLDRAPCVSARLLDAEPQHRYGGVLFIEKEGFGQLLEAARIAERFDVAIASTKGMSVVALRELLDRLSGENPNLQVFALTDFDVTGMGIRPGSQPAGGAMSSRTLSTSR
jgi:Histidine kinase-, DNA gyrase B-, and HSP90-like ATPase